VDYDATSLHRYQPFHVDAARVKRLTEMAAALRVTLCDVLLAGVAIALQRELKTGDICLRHLWHGRDAPGLFDMIGSTVNPVILRVRLNPESGLRDVAQQVHRVAREAFANQVPCYYVDKILNATGAAALVQTNFTLQESAGDPADGGTAVSPLAEPIRIWNPDRAFATPRHLQAHDINLLVDNGAVTGGIVYLESVYEDETIIRFIRELDKALQGTTNLHERHRVPGSRKNTAAPR
jgi:hypothetical protein